MKIFIELTLSGDLGHSLVNINEVAQERLDRIMSPMQAAWSVTGKLKHNEQMGWIGTMYSIRSPAEEIVRSEIIRV